MVFEQQMRVEQQIVEVECVGCFQALLQLLIHARRDLRAGVARGAFREFARSHKFVFRRRNAIANVIDRPALRIQIELAVDIFHEALRIVIVVDGEALVETELLAIDAQNAHAHAMESRHPHATRARAHEPAQTLAHLGGRLVGERDSQNLPGLHAIVGEHMRDAIREHARFARTGTRKHEQRALGAQHGLALRGVQGIDIDASHISTYPSLE